MQTCTWTGHGGNKLMWYSTTQGVVRLADRDGGDVTVIGLLQRI